MNVQLIQKTVFLSYRRITSLYVARSIFQDLHHNGFDVFMDIEGLGSGQFEAIILNQIAAKAHFVVILERGSLDNINRPGDWLNKEIEHAIETDRNIIPIILDNYSIDQVKESLPKNLMKLLDYNFLHLHDDYFGPGMEKLRNIYLNKPTSIAMIHIPIEEQRIVAKRLENLEKIAINEEIAYIDSVGRVEDFSIPTVIALKNGTSISIYISGENKRKMLEKITELRPRHSKFSNRRWLYTYLLFRLLKGMRKIDRIEIDEEYRGHSPSIKEHLLNMLGVESLRKSKVSFSRLNKRSPAYRSATRIFEARSGFSKEVKDYVSPNGM